MALRLWRVEVVLVVQKLLSLGSTYQVRYLLSEAPPDDVKFQDVGLKVAAVVNSHVFQVTETQNEPPMVGTSTDDGSSICSIEAGDYLVGMGVDDFLVCPRSLEQVEQDVTAAGVEAARGEMAVVLRFVRMGAFVRDVGRTPGNILSILDELKSTCENLLTRYELLAAENEAVVEELRSSKELLKYVKIMGCEARKTLMEDPKFKFADKFRAWYGDMRRNAEEAAVNVTDLQQQSPRLSVNDGSTDDHGKIRQH
ncbi:hypothetical protein PHYSODRAFT_250719 [Phytophthora sojae]|uniref:Uncharacterized protein n=1 Tax=Phytophthora sojae (strain P6497) TaxID=1094619 RepID=G4ZXU2_PHYSP|nr:hypothetical protein PHYSODRAFT_250719 [Phytophthora sojae]EGZ11900.1 hypothetical protein PHYSODRAFT_250719 [Phytophthora sojae]|eukprot:XP_009532233.1 hypothetical protein PHYSODRAFT_250719 [Phytophthora sojae]